MSMEYTIEGWGKEPLNELYKLQQSGRITILSEEREKKFFPILEGDDGEEAAFTSITITYEGDLW